MSVGPDKPRSDGPAVHWIEMTRGRDLTTAELDALRTARCTYHGLGEVRLQSAAPGVQVVALRIRSR